MTDARPQAPAAVRWIVQTLEDEGFETWTVGGAVRDALLLQPSGDWDLATRATPGEVRRLFKRTVPIGIEHGTVGILARDRVMYEITTFRKDVETDGRHAVVAFANTIEEDLARRDFTVNAIAWHPLREVYCDPFSGTTDLHDRVLRTVGVAEERFREDYLRILRALRFAGRFELQISDETWGAMCSLVLYLPSLSAERVREELLKVLSGDAHPGRSLELYGSSGSLRVLYPELEEVRAAPVGDDAPRTAEGVAIGAWPLALGAVTRLPHSLVDLRLAALLRPLDPAAAVAVLTRLRLSNRRTDDVGHLAVAGPLPPESATDADVRTWLSVNGPERLNAIARLELAEARGAWDAGLPADCQAVVSAWRRTRDVRRAAPPLSVGDLVIDGRGLVRLGLRPGPQFGEILESLLEWVLEDPSRNEAATLEARVHELTEVDRQDV
jgi:tRNA nucleotidyltransferase (CCA-adding enzyme)